jgi:hypothetical protein
MWTTGDRVLAHRPPGDFWYPGVIRHIQDDRFFIIYDDGEDGFVKAKQMMPLRLEPGDHLFVRHPPDRDYAPAWIVDKQGDQLQVKDEAGRVAWAETAHVRMQPEARKRLRERVGTAARWAPGDRVFACWFDLCWYSGCVLAVEGNQVSVVFDHGGHAIIPPANIHALELTPGDRVQARWKAGAEFFPGVVASRDGEVVTIDYDDGDHETTLVRLVRLERDEWLPELPHDDLGAGDRVLGRWFDGFWYPGIILSITGRRVHVLFDDNDQALLTWDRVKPLQVNVGDRVFCRFQGGPFFHAAEVTQQKGERIFVVYEDGREEWSSVRLIRVDGESQTAEAEEPPGEPGEPDEA